MLITFATVALIGSQAQGQRLPPMPKLGEPLSEAVDWCQTVGAKIDKTQAKGSIHIGCTLDKFNIYGFGGLEQQGYRIESMTSMTVSPYAKPQGYEGPFDCASQHGRSCQVFTRKTAETKSRSMVLFSSKSDPHAIWQVNHKIRRK
jgi:hypothetical protein